MGIPKVIKANKVSIGINVLFLIPGKVGGSEIFLRNLVEQLSKTKTERYVIFTNRENRQLFENLPENFEIISCPISASNRFLRMLWEQMILPLQCLRYKIDVLHSPGYTAPLISYCKKITTIFDLNYHFHPEDFNPLQLIVYKALIPLVSRTSNKIIVHSDDAKEEMVKVLKINPNKITVIYPGVDKIFYEKSSLREIDNLISEYKVSRPYIMSNAVSYPHKNLSSLIRAYAKLAKEKGVSHGLVLLGFTGRAHGKLLRLIKQLRLGKKVIFTGWVNPDEVPLFYQGADIFVFPSLYEGFGLPLLEAMASGTPLIASRYSCIPEVVGKAGILVDTKNPLELAKAMEELLNDENLRRKLVKIGKIRARKFTWRKLALETRQLYLSLLTAKK